MVKVLSVNLPVYRLPVFIEVGFSISVTEKIAIMVELIICIVFASPFYPCGTINSKDVLLLTILGSSTSFRPAKDVLLLTIFTAWLP